MGARHEHREKPTDTLMDVPQKALNKRLDKQYAQILSQVLAGWTNSDHEGHYKPKVASSRSNLQKSVWAHHTDREKSRDCRDWDGKGRFLCAHSFGGSGPQLAGPVAWGPVVVHIMPGVWGWENPLGNERRAKGLDYNLLWEHLPRELKTSH